MKNWVSTPAGVGDPNYQIANQVKNIACGIWNNYTSGFVPNNPVTSPIKNFWNSACSMPPTNQPPVTAPPPPFTGGQCPGVVYIVTVRVIIRNTIVGCPITTDNTFDVTVTGPVQGIEIEVTQPDAGFSQCAPGDFQPIDRVTYRVVGQTSVDIATNAPVSTGTVPNPLSSAEILGIVRQDGLPDDCGDPFTPFPPFTPPPVTNYDIDIFDGDTNITIDVTWTGDFTIPLTFNFEGGVINFDFGGISIEWSGDINFGGGDASPYPEKPPITLPPGQPPPGGGGTIPKPGDPPVIIAPPIPVTPIDPIEEEPPEDETFLYLEIIVTAIQQDSKFIIENVNTADSIYFAGYVSFTVKSKPGFTSAPEIPIRRQNNLIYIPPQYDGYRVRATNGANLTVTSFSVKKNPAKT